MKERPIEFKSFDGRADVRIGHGKNCVLLLIAEGDGTKGAIVLTDKEADQLALSIRQQVRYSQEEQE